MMTPPRLGVLVSGSGRSLLNLLERQFQGRLGGTVELVISSRDGVQALDHARRFGVVASVLSTADITKALDGAGIDVVVMAGYLRRWALPPKYVGRTLNIHPSLLPLFGGKGFYGDRVHRAVLESGMRVSGCTVHYVTDIYDEGPIIAQRAVPVLPTDDVETLAGRVFLEELALLPEVIGLHTRGEVALRNGRVVYGAGSMDADGRSDRGMMPPPGSD